MRDVIGHGRLLARLGEQLTRGEGTHAYGLYGPRSVGKRTIALRIAQTLSCERAVSGGCGRCLACRKVERGIHPDVRTISRSPANKDISIEQVRDGRRDLALRPLEGRYRVVIVDDAAELNQFGQDALLKTLEEPPAHAVLLLLTTTPSALHETIRSRLQPLALRLVPRGEIADGLRLRGVTEADRYAAAGAGLPGLAIQLAAEGTARTTTDRRRIEDELYRVISSGLTDRFGWAATLNELPDDDRTDRERTREIRRRRSDWAELMRDAAVAARGDVARPLRPERAAESAKLAGSVAAKDLVSSALLLDRLRRDLAFNANARAMLELLALRLPYSAAVKTA